MSIIRIAIGHVIYLSQSVLVIASMVLGLGVGIFLNFSNQKSNHQIQIPLFYHYLHKKYVSLYL